MRTAKFTVKTTHGLHARVAYAIANAAKALTSRITLKKGAQTADADSVLQILMLAASKDAEIEVFAEGGNEEDSLKKIEEFFSEGTGI
jgi:phosphocarrier protein HPr